MRILITIALVLGLVVILWSSMLAQSPENKVPPSEKNAPLLVKKVLSLAAARTMTAAAIKEAERNHWRGVVAVVDDGGWLILLERIDHAAMTASVELAAGKARTAALFKKPSQELEDAINRGRYAAITARGFVEMCGAFPAVIDGEVVGAIGASFATPEEDVQVAKAGLAAADSVIGSGRNEGNETHSKNSDVNALGRRRARDGEHDRRLHARHSSLVTRHWRGPACPGQRARV